MAVNSSEDPRYPGLSSHQAFYNSVCYSLNVARRAAHTFYNISRLSFFLLISSLSLSLSLSLLPSYCSSTSKERQRLSKFCFHHPPVLCSLAMQLERPGQCNAASALNVTPFPALTPGAVLPTASRLLLKASNPLTLRHLPLCHLIALNSRLALFYCMTRTLAVVLSFSTSRAYSFLNSQLPLSLR